MSFDLPIFGLYHDSPRSKFAAKLDVQVRTYLWGPPWKSCKAKSSDVATLLRENKTGGGTTGADLGGGAAGGMPMID